MVGVNVGGQVPLPVLAKLAKRFRGAVSFFEKLTANWFRGAVSFFEKLTANWFHGAVSFF
jgi:hypothetical protein